MYIHSRTTPDLHRNESGRNQTWWMYVCSKVGTQQTWKNTPKCLFFSFFERTTSHTVTGTVKLEKKRTQLTHRPPSTSGCSRRTLGVVNDHCQKSATSHVVMGQWKSQGQPFFFGERHTLNANAQGAPGSVAAKPHAS